MTRREPAILLIATIVALSYRASGAGAGHARLLEIVADLLVAPGARRRRAKRFPLTPLVYRLLFVHALILMVGGHYTYAKVPLGFWVEDALHLGRTTTTASDTSCRASFQRSSRARYCSAARPCGAENGWLPRHLRVPCRERLV